MKRLTYTILDADIRAIVSDENGEQEIYDWHAKAFTMEATPSAHNLGEARRSNGKNMAYTSFLLTEPTNPTPLRATRFSALDIFAIFSAGLLAALVATGLIAAALS